MFPLLSFFSGGDEEEEEVARCPFSLPLPQLAGSFDSSPGKGHVGATKERRKREKTETQFDGREEKELGRGMDDRRPGNTSSFIPPRLGFCTRFCTALSSGLPSSFISCPSPHSRRMEKETRFVDAKKEQNHAKSRVGMGGPSCSAAKKRRQNGKWLKEKGSRTTASNE